MRPPAPLLDERFTDPVFALAFARLVTHYVRNDLFLEDDVLLRNAHLLAGIPGVLINGRFDLQAPLGNAWALHRAWPRAELVVVEDAGHRPRSASLARVSESHPPIRRSVADLPGGWGGG